MKIAGVVSLLLALCAGGVLLGSYVPDYSRVRSAVAANERRAADYATELATARSTGHGLEIAMRKVDSIRASLAASREDLVHTRNDTLVVAGATFALFAFGAFMLMRSRRRRSAAGDALVAA